LKKLISVLILSLGLVGCASTPLYTVQVGPGVSVKIYKAPCESQVAKDLAEGLGAPAEAVAELKKAEVVTPAETIPGCAYVFKDKQGFNIMLDNGGYAMQVPLSK
jgi:hypothetical protein